ncbi:efflux RND transporter permease subunit [Rhodocista pekingensis]|uniref:Efflux RND transporter permease subunit n=1 Tax=Rhodocista pekingensis TaxID=201185 RepID=A0ABW2KYC7_9PROT
MKADLSGTLARATIRSPLTPLFLLAALIMGLIATLTIPREEEPQISVPMVDILVTADGLKAPDAVELVTKPLEAIVKAIDGVEHVYSQTRDDRAMVTARFVVGTDADAAILRVHEKLRANYDRIPLGIPEPLVVGRGINDVAIVVATLAPTPDAAAHWTGRELYRLAETLRSEIAKIEDVGLTTLVGGSPEQIRVEPDPERLALQGVTLAQLAAKLEGANRSFLAGGIRREGGAAEVAAGQTLAGIPDIGLLLLTTRDGRPVYVKDVADVVFDTVPVESRAWHIVPPAPGGSGAGEGTAAGAVPAVPAVSLAVAKRPGANAVVVAEHVLKQIEAQRGTLLPDDVQVLITRNYGETANEKANELLFHLGLATVSIVLLVGVAVGRREALVTLVVIPTTILLTLAAAKLMGYTINRVSLFALIFSIGILVDDAIVVVENIARHWAMRDGRGRLDAAVDAVAEVGNPTIVATLAVIAALLPMLFVSGMMGPYMAPIPVNASAAMLFSFFVAVMIAPWLMGRLAPKEQGAPGAPAAGGHHDGEGRLGRLYRAVAGPVLASRRRSGLFLGAVGLATVLSTGLVATKAVTVKLLPFDNKSEFQVVVDLPEGASLEQTERTLFAAAERLARLPEVVSIQAYAGTAAPFNFNGLVRHSYLRADPEMGDLQVNLTPKGDRSRDSHAIALAARALLADLPVPAGTALKVVEVPPGPPVLATLLAEVYGPDAETRRALATKLRGLFESVPFITDVDDSFGTPRPRLRIAIDQDQLEYFGVQEQDVYDTVRLLLHGIPVGYSHRGDGRAPVEIAVQLPKSSLAWTEALAATPVAADTQPGSRAVVELGDVVRIVEEPGSHQIFRRNGRPAEMVTAELAGAFEAPIYGMLAVDRLIEETDWGGLPRPEILLHGQPDSDAGAAVLWDGEWEVTYVTFRDMGAAFAVAILGIYVLVVAQFGSFRLPLVVLTPVPLTLVGIMIGHWIFGAPFSATSMIGFIALAGIIVRNSILLVDFIRHGAQAGGTLREVLLQAGAVRFKPILLTALAAMIGAATILFDPIFQGLAISLLFGLASSTLLTVLVVPAIYIVVRGPDRPATPA